MVSWGGTYGACVTAVDRLQTEGYAVSHAHLRYLNPFPRNLETLLRSFRHVLVPELNMGQLRTLLCAVPGRRAGPEQGARQTFQRARDHREDSGDAGLNRVAGPSGCRLATDTLESDN